MAADMLSALVILAATSATPTKPETRHDLEIETYVLVLAVAQVASDNCSDILISKPFLQAIGDHVVLSADDAKATTEGAKAKIEQLKRDVAADRMAWCDEVYKLYGPTGTVLPQLLARSSDLR